MQPLGMHNPVSSICQSGHFYAHNIGGRRVKLKQNIQLQTLDMLMVSMIIRIANVFLFLVNGV